jgi:hypothetical protein
VRDAVFTVSDLAEIAIRDPALAAALTAAFGAGKSWRLIAGKLFALCEAAGHDVDGLMIERRCNEREGAVWALVDTSAGLKTAGKSQTRAGQ